MTSKNKKIFVSGAGGMLGQAFYKVFSSNYDLKCIDKDANEKWISFLDFRDFDNYKKHVDSFSPDYLFHIGAHTDLEFCENNIEDTYLTNTKSVEYASYIANNHNIPLLYISTAGIFDGKKEFYDEGDKPQPLCHYAKSKYQAEMYVQKNSKKYIICRAGWMMGGGPKKDKKFINKIFKQLNEGKKELNVVNDKSGAPTYTLDFAKNVKVLIEKNIYGLFNLVSKGNATRYEVAQEMLNILKLNHKIRLNSVNSSFFEKTYFAKRPKSEILINKKLNLLNLNVMRDWKICLREYIYNDFVKEKINDDEN